MRTGKLTSLKVKTLSKPGLYPDGGGLYCQVTSATGKSWLYRYSSGGKEHWLGLGAVDLVSLAEAREKTLAMRKLRQAGLDPKEEKQHAKKKAAEDGAAKTFSEVMSIYLDSHTASWKNPKHAAQWKSTLETYVVPIFGEKLVREITSETVLSALKPIWLTKAETAGRVRGRVEAILGYAAALGWRPEANPASWTVLKNLLPPKSRIVAVKHHPAVPYAEIPACLAELKQNQSNSAACLEFLILTAARSGEARGAVWSEFDMQLKVWTVPAHRMKAKKEHRVALSEPAIKVLQSMKKQASETGNGFVFPGAKANRPLSDMALTMKMRATSWPEAVPHGFRASFKTWASEATNFQREIVEAALAHAIGGKVEQAYSRGDLFEKRVKLMAAWGAYCAGAQRNNVTRLPGTAA